MTTSCGIAMMDGRGRYLLVKAGGPIFARKERNYTFPKGEMMEGEEPEECARREFFEETGHRIDGSLTLVYEGKIRADKRIMIFVGEGEFDGSITSNTCEIEFPPKSGKTITIPEVCDPKMMTEDEAEKVIFVSQLPVIEELRKYKRQKYGCRNTKDGDGAAETDRPVL